MSHFLPQCSAGQEQSTTIINKTEHVKVEVFGVSKMCIIGII